MAPVDVSAFANFLPILSFLVVLLISYFVIHKTEIIGAKFWEFALAFAIAIIFVTAAGPRNYILAIIPWFAIVIVGAFLIMTLTGLVGKDVIPTKGLGYALIAILAVIFVVSAIFIFYAYFSPYLPGSSGSGGNPVVLSFLDWITSPRIGGTILVLGVGLVVGWIITKK